MYSKERAVIRKELRNAIIKKRAELRISQEKMSGLLHISLRSYTDIEHGKSMPCTYTLINFMLLFKNDVFAMLKEIENKINETEY